MQEEQLVPIRLDMEIEGQRLRDMFTWNKNGEATRGQARVARRMYSVCFDTLCCTGQL